MSRQLRMACVVLSAAALGVPLELCAATLRDHCIAASSQRLKPNPKRFSFGFPERENIIYERFELYVLGQKEKIGSLFMVAVFNFGTIGARLVEYDLDKYWDDPVSLAAMLKRFLEMNYHVQFINWPVEEGSEGKVNQGEHQALQMAGLELDQTFAQRDKKSMESSAMTWARYVRKEAPKLKKR